MYGFLHAYMLSSMICFSLQVILKLKMNRLTLYLVITVVVSSALLIIVHAMYAESEKSPATKKHLNTGMSCGGSHACGAQDPVSEPSYNMKEVIKQSILLEEHLTIVSKRCKDCIAKHFLHIEGLVSEAIMLACDRVGQYPYMKECNQEYQVLFQAWLQNKDDDENLRMVARKLREVRKKLVAVYILQTSNSEQEAHETHDT